MWVACTSTDPIPLLGDLQVCRAKQFSLKEWPIGVLLKLHFSILYGFITVFFFPFRGFSSQYKSHYTEKYLSHVRPLKNLKAAVCLVKPLIYAKQAHSGYKKLRDQNIFGACHRNYCLRNV